MQARMQEGLLSAESVKEPHAGRVTPVAYPWRAGDAAENRGDRGELDEPYLELIRGRLDGLVRRHPVWATDLGVHTEDARLGDGSRTAVLDSLRDEVEFLAGVEALDPQRLSPSLRFDRELAIHAARLAVFDTDVHRVWERRVSAMDEVGDGLFLILARDFAPLSERLEAMTGRLEQAPRVMQEHRTRLGKRPMRLWNELEIEAARSLPGLFHEIDSAARSVWSDGDPALARLAHATEGARRAIDEYSSWIREQLGRADDDFALGREEYDELVRLRAFDGLTSDEILEIGEQQLADNKAARREVARRIDADSSEADVLARVKSNGPATFDDALAGYRDAMFRARDWITAHDLATLPEGERLDVVPTPEYLRKVMPFAAYFQPPRYDERPSGIYVVTPSVNDDPRAMLEHNYSSISNTSIHEAYPGHHLQLSAANTNPSLTRLMVDAPEFVEGWGMYCEQMMREQGFDATPEHLLLMYTDAIWRSCRIVLDVRLHRGELKVREAIDFLVEHTGFERPNATAEVHRYTYTPTYQLSYLLGKVMLLRLRDDEQRRLGEQFSLKGFHDALLYAGSLPVSFQRRLLDGGSGAASRT